MINWHLIIYIFVLRYIVTACKIKIYETFKMKKTNEALEAATFRRLLNHLSNRTDVQNLDLMDLAGFCRNCLSRWYSEEAKKQGLNIDKDEARELIYGMPYEKWKGKFQLERNSLDIEKVMKRNEEANSD